MIGRVPRLWPGETIVVLGDGPSLTREDVDYCRGRARVIAVNFSARLAPWAHVVYSYHTTRLLAHSQIDPVRFPGLIFSVEPAPATWPLLRDTGRSGLEMDPSGLRTGNNSGYGAIGIAKHLGARRIVLLGFDCQPAVDGCVTWRGCRDATVPGIYEFALWLTRFRTLPGPLQACGIELVNASRATAIDCFPRQPLREALS